MRASTKRKTKAKAKPRAKAKPKAKAKRASTTSFKVESMSLKELLELEKQVQLAIQAAQNRERTGVLEKMKEIASESGFTMDELVGGRGRGRGKAKAPAVAKYQNPDNPEETWTGRGRKPNWLVARIKKGATLEEFAL